MTLKEHYDKAKTWQRKATIISFYHNGMVLKKRGKWKLRQTADYFNVSIGKVSEDINLCLNLGIIKHHTFRQNALEQLRKTQ
jgi:hypothetical protein